MIIYKFARTYLTAFEYKVLVKMIIIDSHQGGIMWGFRGNGFTNICILPILLDVPIKCIVLGITGPNDGGSFS